MPETQPSRPIWREPVTGLCHRQIQGTETLNLACAHAQSLSRVQLLATPWTVAQQAPLSMGFSRQEYWSRLLFPPPGDFPDPRMEPTSPALAGGFLNTEPPTFPRCGLISRSSWRLKHTEPKSLRNHHFLKVDTLLSQNPAGDQPMGELKAFVYFLP